MGDRHLLNQKFSLQLTVLLWQNHHPRVLPKASLWKVVSMCKSSRSSGAGPRKFTPSWSRMLNSFVLCCNFCACMYGGSAVPQKGVGDRHLVTVPRGVVGDRLS